MPTSNIESINYEVARFQYIGTGTNRFINHTRIEFRMVSKAT